MASEMKTINLELADPDAYKQPLKSQYYDIKNIDRIFEILGSVERYEDPLEIKITITQSNFFISHNGKPFDQHDIKRFLKMATHKLNENRKGVSKQGTGLRAVFAVQCEQSHNINFEDNSYEYTTQDFYKCSSVLTKVNSDIQIDESTRICKDDLLTFIHDSNFNIKYENHPGRNKFYQDIYQQHLNDHYGVLFIVPNNSEIDKSEDEYIIHKLKLLFNRSDCSLIYENKVTSTKKNIFEKKPFYYVDPRIKDNRYLECKCETFTYKDKKILKLDLLEHKDIDPELTTGKSHYFWINTHRNGDDEMKKFEYNDWSIPIEDETQLIPENYVFKLRMMSFDPDLHSENQDFIDWFNFYNHHTRDNNYGDGIVPYIENQCLRYDNYEGQKKYLKMNDFGPQKTLLRGGGFQGKVAPKQWKRTVKNKLILYKTHQNFLCEYIESKGVDSEKSILNLNPIKSHTKVCDSQKVNGKGMNKSLPYFFLWLAHKYVWFQASEETISLSQEEQISQLEDKNVLLQKESEKAKKEAMKAKKEAEKERVKAEKERQKAERERKKADEERQNKIMAQEKAKLEKTKKEKAIVSNKKISELLQESVTALQETNEESIELKKSIEEDYVPKEDEKNLDKGFCYCLMSPAMPQYRKIGQSSQIKSELKKQYSSRYMPEEVQILEWVSFDNSKLAEKHIFEKLKGYRHGNTEWFKFSPEDPTNTDQMIHKVFNDYKTFMENNTLS